jgi:hypothetical protein
MTMRNRAMLAVFSFVIVAAMAVPVSAAQFGAGLHYLRTLDDNNFENPSQDDFSIFGTITIPVLLVQVEGNLEWVPDYFGENLIQPAVYGKLPLGPIYGSVGIGIGYLTGEDDEGSSYGWATNPFYALRAGIDLGLGGLAIDAFAAYRFQSASFGDALTDVNLDALTLAAQIKFGG